MKLAAVPLLCLLAFLSLGKASPLWAQIVNTEALRLKEESDGWSGNIGVSTSFSKNVDMIYIAGGNSRVQYKKGKSTFTLLGMYNLLEFNDQFLRDEGYTHLRYSYDLNNWLVPEAFSQIQTNSLQRLDYRVLNGLGVRLIAIADDSANFYLRPGTMQMFEYEVVENNDEINRIFRNSSYLNIAWKVKDNLSISHTTYFQPNLEDLEDFRILSDTQANFKIFQHLFFNVTYSLFYDTRPPEAVPTTFYSLSNGLTYKF